MKELAYFSGYVGSSSIPAISLASRLMEITYDNMQAVFFTCGGAESNESAFKTARFYWKAKGKPDKVKIIARQQGYHGVTLQAMSATGMGAYWKMFEPRVPGFVHIQTCYPYRFQGAKPGETVGQAAARELEEAILREGADTVAAFIGEPIHGGGGVIYPTDDYWPARARGLQPPRRAADRRRGHHRLLPDRPLVRARALERQARHRLVRQGRDVGLPAARRHHGHQGHQGRDGLGQARGPLDARLHLLRPSDVLRGRAQERRDHGARAALGERGEDGDAASRGAPAGVRRPSQRRRHPRRQGAAGGGRAGGGPRDQEELPRRQEGRAAHPGRDDEARRRHADAAGGRARIRRPATRSTSRRRSSSPRRRSTGSSASRATPSRSCSASDAGCREADHRPPHPHRRGDRVLRVLRGGPLLARAWTTASVAQAVVALAVAGGLVLYYRTLKGWGQRPPS